MASFAALKAARQGRQQRGWVEGSTTRGPAEEGAANGIFAQEEDDAGRSSDAAAGRSPQGQPVGGADAQDVTAEQGPVTATADDAEGTTRVDQANVATLEATMPQDGPLPSSAEASPLEHSYRTHPELEALLDLPPHLEIRSTSASGRSVFLRDTASAPASTTTISGEGAASSSPQLRVPRANRITRGTTILCAKPAVAALGAAELEGQCSACWLSVGEIGGPGAGPAGVGSAAVALRKCAGCGIVRYCGRTCQAHDWPGHQHECASLRATAQRKVPSSGEGEGGGAGPPRLPSENVRALGRICWARRRGRDKGEQGPERMWKQVSALDSHRKSLSAAQAEPFAALAMALARYLHAGQAAAAADSAMDMRVFGFVSVSEVMNLCCAFATNSFTLASPALAPLGVTSSPAIAMFNHACVPNAVVVFPWGAQGRVRGGAAGAGAAGWEGMEVVALRDIEPGEEILTSYIDVTLPVHLRQKELERYHFTCRCALCAADAQARQEGRANVRWAIGHPGCPRREGVAVMPDEAAATKQTPAICETCGAGFEVDAIRIHKIIKRGQAILDRSVKGDEVTPAEVCAATQALQAVLPLSSHPLPALLRLEATTLSAPTPGTDTIPNLFAAIRASSLSFKAIDPLLPFGHPLRGIVLAELGKLLNLERDDDASPSAPDSAAAFLPRGVSGRLHLARETLVKALSELRAGFGMDGGMVGREVMVLVDGLTREMQAREGIAVAETRGRMTNAAGYTW